MTKKFSISIPQPCPARWEQFSSVATGGFCGSCNKTVIDFTGMNDREIIEFFMDKPTRTCGRFRSSQLTDYTYDSIAESRPGFTLLTGGIAGLLLLISGAPACAQVNANPTQTVAQPDVHNRTPDNAFVNDHLIRGVVTDEAGNGFPGVSIVLKGTTTGTTTDLNGNFEFPKRLQRGDVLLFSFIGYETKEYTVPRNVSEIVEINLPLDVCFTLGEVAVESLYEDNRSILQKMVAKVKAVF
jgi:hypothetical protein